MENDDLLKPVEVAKMLRCHRGTVNRLLECGRLRGFSIHTGKRKKWRIPRASVIAFMNEPASVEPDICSRVTVVLSEYRAI